MVPAINNNIVSSAKKLFIFFCRTANFTHAAFIKEKNGLINPMFTSA